MKLSVVIEFSIGACLRAVGKGPPFSRRQPDQGLHMQALLLHEKQGGAPPPAPSRPLFRHSEGQQWEPRRARTNPMTQAQQIAYTVSKSPIEKCRPIPKNQQDNADLGELLGA